MKDPQAIRDMVTEGQGRYREREWNKQSFDWKSEGMRNFGWSRGPKKKPKRR